MSFDNTSVTLPQINQRKTAAGVWDLNSISSEAFTTSVDADGLYTAQLAEVPAAANTDGSNAAPIMTNSGGSGSYTLTTSTSPSVGEFYVDYDNGIVIVNSSDHTSQSGSFEMTYSGKGTVLKADEINAILTNSTTLNSNIVTSSLTTVGALDSGSITEGFGDIDNGTNNIRTGGLLYIDVDGTSLGAAGSLTFGAGADAGIFFDGADLIIRTDGSGASGIILDSEDDTVEIKGSGTLQATFSTSGLNLAASDAYSIGGVDILSDSAGTTTLSNIDALDATTESTIESAIDTLSNLTTVGALDSGSITSGFGSIDNGTSSITTGGLLYIDVDGTSLGAAGSLTFGVGADAGMFFDGTDLIIRTDGAGASGIILDSEDDTIEIMGSGVLQATFSTSGLDLAASDAYSIGGVDILSDSAGTTTLSNIDALDATTESTIESAIDTLSNLTTVGALDSGSITSGFGSIDNGTSNIRTGGLLFIDVDGTSGGSAGSITLGAGADAYLVFNGTDLIISTTGPGTAFGIILDAEDDTVEIKGSGTLQATFDTSGLSIVEGMIVGSPTGGFKGTGTINAVAVYDDDVILTDFVFKEDYNLLSIDEMSSFFRKNHHLPWIMGEKEWIKKGKPSTGQLLNMIYETVENQAIYISQIHERLSKIEG